MEFPEHHIYRPEDDLTISLIDVENVTETDVQHLHPADVNRLNDKIHHNSKRREFIASRAALRSIRNNYMLHYEGRCPILDGPGFISLAHSPDYGAAIFHPNRRVGIDVEPVREKLYRLGQKFLNEEEWADVQKGNAQFKLQILWGAKEALFKLHRMGGIEFKKHLFIDPIPESPSGVIKARIITEKENTPCRIGYFQHQNQYVVYAVSEVPL